VLQGNGLGAVQDDPAEDTHAQRHDAAIAAACPITSAMEMQSQSSNVSAVFFLIRVQAALAASMVSSKPPFE
jgi:hypothetical protein